MKIPLSFTVDTEDDADIIEHFNSLPYGQKSQFMRTAYRCRLIEEAGPTLQDVLDAIQELRATGLALQTQDQENPALVDALTQLGEF